MKMYYLYIEINKNCKLLWKITNIDEKITNIDEKVANFYYKFQIFI